jgi:hypothetical protein
MGIIGLVKGDRTMLTSRWVNEGTKLCIFRDGRLVSIFNAETMVVGFLQYLFGYNIHFDLWELTGRQVPTTNNVLEFVESFLED